MSSISKQELPIGIFDSGVGGLTVLRALQQLLPNEHFLYLGDTARLPYGTKSAETVKTYALNANEVLISTGIKMLVVACNTATAAALGALQERFYPLPVIGVIEPGANASLAIESTGPIVVLATEGTVKGRAYYEVLKALAPNRQVIEWPCSLFVALAEEGWCEGALVEQIILRVLSPLLVKLENISPACMLLGCTHFPALKEAMQNVVGSVPIIDPAYTVAKEVHSFLQQHNLLRRTLSQPAKTRFMATDGAERFARVAQIFLQYALTPYAVELVTLAPTLPVIESTNIVNMVGSLK